MILKILNADTKMNKQHTSATVSYEVKDIEEIFASFTYEKLDNQSLFIGNNDTTLKTSKSLDKPLISIDSSIKTSLVLQNMDTNPEDKHVLISLYKALDAICNIQFEADKTLADSPKKIKKPKIESQAAKAIGGLMDKIEESKKDDNKPKYKRSVVPRFSFFW